MGVPDCQQFFFRALAFVEFSLSYHLYFYIYYAAFQGGVPDCQQFFSRSCFCLISVSYHLYFLHFGYYYVDKVIWRHNTKGSVCAEIILIIIIAVIYHQPRFQYLVCVSAHYKLLAVFHERCNQTKLVAFPVEFICPLLGVLPILSVKPQCRKRSPAKQWEYPLLRTL